MSSLVDRLRKRPDHRPVYTSYYDYDSDSDSDSDSDDFIQNDNQAIVNFHGTIEREEVSPLIEMERILDCEMRPTTSKTRPTTSNDPNESDNVVPKETIVKHYLVKWKRLSYLHCSWVPEEVFQKAYKCIHHLRSSVNNFHSKMESIRNKGYDFVAIRPEWIIVDRIIACRGEDDEKEYLVKYKELSYDECYWELESNISTFKKEIQKFMDVNSGHRRDIYVENERNHMDFKKFDHTPEFLKGSLHPYQLEGLNFLRFSWSKQTHVILADEMGLGKTIQSIAFLASLFEENLAPFLVVAPLSTLPNWEREFATWAPHMNVVMYVGTPHARSVIRQFEFYFPKGHNKFNRTSESNEESKQDKIKFDVLLTSYEMINMDTKGSKPKDKKVLMKSIDAKVLKNIKWKCMIVDEGHRLKNMDSKLFSSLKQYTSMHRVLLTGTPLQNKLDELFTLMHFLDAKKFGSLKNFQDEYKDISQEEQISRLHKMLAPHLLRRLKKDVLKDMPTKKELILRVDMSIQQKEIYKAILTRNFKILTKRGSKIKNVFMELRKVCLHPYMLEGVQPIIEDANEAYKQLVESSGKLQLLDKLMVRLKEQGHRVLIYTQFQHMLDLLEDYCTYKNWFYERLDGKVRGAERQIRIDRFNAENSNRFCFVLSTRAGGLGINLATADTVIIYDSDWNPHADLQAMARAHRIGQTNKVMIYRLINRGTVEEKMVQIAKKKMLLEHLVVGELNSEKLSQAELDDIVKYGSKELFSEENEEAGTSSKIHYGDAAIEKLLDRDQVDDEEVSTDDEKENEFLKTFKVANFEYINENEDAALEEAQTIENKSLVDKSDRVSYWKDLLKDKYEEDKAEELIVLGKRKRSGKKISFDEEDNLPDIEVSSDENYKAEPTDDEAEAAEQEIPKVERKTCIRRGRKAHNNSKPIPLMEGEGRSLKVLGFNQKQRLTFSKTFMRYGVGDYEWKEFVNPLKSKTYEEIKAYAILFLQHISEDIPEDASQNFSDGVPKEGLVREDVLVRISVLTLTKEKLKMLEDNPKKPIFTNRILEKFPALNGERFWKEEHDKMLLHAVSKHGYGKWQIIIDDTELGMQEVICKQLQIPYISLSPAQQAAFKGNVYSYGEHANAIICFKDMMKKLSDFVRRRFHILEEALKYEYAKEDYEQNSSASVSAAEQGETIKNVIDTEAEKEMLDQESKTNPITSEEITKAVVDNKEERVEVAQSYNKMSKDLGENSSGLGQTYVNRQQASSEVRENVRPLKSIFQNIHMSLSGTRAEHGVERKDSVQEPFHKRTDATNASGRLIEETQNTKD